MPLVFKLHYIVCQLVELYSFAIASNSCLRNSRLVEYTEAVLRVVDLRRLYIHVQSSGPIVLMHRRTKGNSCLATLTTFSSLDRGIVESGAHVCQIINGVDSTATAFVDVHCPDNVAFATVISLTLASDRVTTVTTVRTSFSQNVQANVSELGFI